MKKSDTKSIKSNNTALLYECLRNGAQSRAQIAQISGLSKATVTAIVTDLIAKGALCETGTTENTGVGRPRAGLAIVNSYRYVIGMALHRRKLSVSLIDLASQAISTDTFPTSDFATPAQALDTLYDTALRRCEELGIEKERLIGIGVSAPGPLDYKNGVIQTPPDLPLFRDAPVREHLQARSSLPVYLDNNATLLAMHEHRLRHGKLQNWIFIVADNGVGSALFSSGRLYRGSGGYAGELGHTSIERNGLPCACGNCGCLERYVSMDALRARFGFNDYRDVIARAKEGDAAALDILRYVADCFSHALVNYVNLVNPEAIVFYGELNDDAGLLLGMIEERLHLHSTVAGIQPVCLYASEMGESDLAAADAGAILEAYFAQKLKP